MTGTHNAHSSGGPDAVCFVPGAELSAGDISNIVSLHVSCIPHGFLSRLGGPILAPLYGAMQGSPHAVLIAAFAGKRAAGFVAGSTSTSALYRDLFRRTWFRGGWPLLVRFLSPRDARRIAEALRYPFRRRASHTQTPAELLSIAVAPGYRRTGIGAGLFRELVGAYGRLGIGRFRIVVGEGLVPARRFYEKMGACRAGETVVHKGERSLVYVYPGRPDPGES